MDLALAAFAIALVAAIASALTLVSGFGLGTILLPAFALFFPVPTAVAATGVVHLLNNIFKGGLLHRRTHWPTVWRIGIPAVPAAMFGAWLLAQLGTTPPLFHWTFAGQRHAPTGASVSIGLLLSLFAMLELWPRFQALQAPPRLMPLGGLLTGFFGGLTGQQGALRSIFLLRAGITPPNYVATGVMIALLVDVSRLGTYITTFHRTGLNPHGGEAFLVAIATLAALLGAWFAAQRIDKMTIGWIRVAVASLMLLVGIGLMLGLIGTR